MPCSSLTLALFALAAATAADITTTILYPYATPGSLHTNTYWPTGESYAASIIAIKQDITTL